MAIWTPQIILGISHSVNSWCWQNFAGRDRSAIPILQATGKWKKHKRHMHLKLRKPVHREVKFIILMTFPAWDSHQETQVCASNKAIEFGDSWRTPVALSKAAFYRWENTKYVKRVQDCYYLHCFAASYPHMYSLEMKPILASKLQLKYLGCFKCLFIFCS